MLARLEASLPRGDHWCYEPKFDGFRGLLWRAPNGGVHLLSRNLKDISPSFPEFVRAGDALAPGALVDGEIVIADATGRSDFGALQGRLSVGKRDARSGASREPAVLLAFDLLKLVPGPKALWPSAATVRIYRANVSGSRSRGNVPRTAPLSA
jgi:ATP-dependent DNA ligase